MTTKLADIALGSTVFVKGIKFDADDIAINADKKSQSAYVRAHTFTRRVMLNRDAAP
jgi:hypothetical protein